VRVWVVPVWARATPPRTDSESRKPRKRFIGWRVKGEKVDLIRFGKPHS
jgi:hypothetical protein